MIALPNSFDIYGIDSEFFSIVRKKATCPVISLQSEVAGAYSILIEDRDGYPQAIICANDLMALSICDELKRRGKRMYVNKRSYKESEK